MDGPSRDCLDDKFIETKEFEVRCSPSGRGGIITKKVKYDIYERPGKDYLVYKKVYESDYEV
jgi:hypothetical protein